MDVVRKRAAVSGQAGKPPMTAMELIENSKTAQSRTRVSTKMEKLRDETENEPHVMGSDSDSPLASGSTTMAGLPAGENVSSRSTAANIESRPETDAAESI